MAKYICTVRSNYFRVKDAKAFEDWCSKIELKCWTAEVAGYPERFHAVSSVQSLESPYYDHLNEEYIDTGFVAGLARHLVDSDIAVFHEVSAKGTDAVVGHAYAIRSDGEFVELDLDAIHAKAARAFGKKKVITKEAR